MKNKLFNAFLLLAMVGMMFTACKKEYPEPPIQDLPIGTVYTIDEILAMEPGTVFTDDASVYGIITADEVSGNLYKAAFMQDRATGAAIELYLNAVSGVRIGDSVRIYLKDVTYAMYRQSARPGRADLLRCARQKRHRAGRLQRGRTGGRAGKGGHTAQ